MIAKSISSKITINGVFFICRWSITVAISMQNINFYGEGDCAFIFNEVLVLVEDLVSIKQ